MAFVISAFSHWGCQRMTYPVGYGGHQIAVECRHGGGGGRQPDANMITINLPLTGAFDARTIELADRFQEAKPSDEFKLCLYDTGNVVVDAALAFYEIVQTRPQGIRVHVHSHVCLMGAEVLIWLAGDTRTLRSNAWIHFREYPHQWLERSDMQQFLDSLEGREVPTGKTAFQENYLTAERLVKKQLPPHLLNRRVWTGELAEWQIVKPAMPTAKAVAPDGASKAKPTAPAPAKVTGNQTQLALF